MSPELRECESQALRLPPEERAVLAERLIASLDELGEAENERLWLVEADRRYQECKRGVIPSRDAQDVLREARSAIR